MRKPTITEQAHEYALTHNDVRQAYIDGYNAALASRAKKKDLDLSFVAPEFVPIIQKWLDYKKERKNAYTQRGAESMYKKLIDLSGGNPQTADAIVEQSVANNWQGLFELNNGNTTAIAPTGQHQYRPNRATFADNRDSVAQLAQLAGGVLRQSPGPFKP